MNENSKAIITAENGEEWSVPVMKIVENKAHYYAGRVPGMVEGSEEWKTEVALQVKEILEGDEYDIQDWAQNNMDWKDVKECAVKVKEPLPNNLDEVWANGIWRFE